MSFGKYGAFFRLVRRFFTRRDLFPIGIASMAWALKALTGSVIFPIAIGQVVSYFNSGGKGIPIIALILLIFSLTVNVGVEWAFLPYYYMFLGVKINDMRKYLAGLINQANRRQDDQVKIVVSSMVGEVEFFVSNAGNSLATIISNSSATVFALVTILSSNLFMAGVSIILLPFYLIVIRMYSNRVFRERMSERTIYANIVKLSGDIINGTVDDNMLEETLKKHNRSTYKLQFLERANWASLYSLNWIGLILLLIIGAFLVDQSILDVGSLVTIILAANAFYGAMTNIEQGLALFIQAGPAAERIDGTIAKMSQNP